MIKLINSDSFKHNMPALSLIDVHRRGVDSSWLEKRAAVLTKEISNIRPVFGRSFIHLIAMGAQDHYGFNRNGDGFPKTASEFTIPHPEDHPDGKGVKIVKVSRGLIEKHPTFVEFGHVFAHHNNKDPKNSSGNIKASAWNEPMQRVELIIDVDNHDWMDELQKIASDEQVAVSMACFPAGTLIYTYSGFKSIEDIKDGDIVLTHLGRFKQVQHCSKRTADNIVTIKTKYYGRQEIKQTPNHEFFTIRWSDVIEYDNWKSKKRHRHELHKFAKWRAAENIQKGDLLLMPIRYGSNNSDITIDNARLAGYYMAEGSLIDNTVKGIALTCNILDAAVREIYDLVDDNITVCLRKHSGSDKCVTVEVYSKHAYDLACEIGRGVANKHIPECIWNASNEHKLHFASTWFNGDGWQDDKGLHWSTCSRSLSLELQMLLASLNIPSSVYRIDHTSDLPNGQIRNGIGVEYTINVSNNYSSMFAVKSKAVTWTPKKKKTTTFITGGYLAIPVTEVRTEICETDVYNFSVDEDESYTAYGFAVHNCRVPYDICNWCSHKAAKVKDYCDHAKNHMTMITKEGHQIGVINEDPTFFDISKVFRPADRIAYTLTKVATDSSILSAELAKNAEIILPQSMSRYLSENSKAATVLAKLADIEKEIKCEIAGAPRGLKITQLHVAIPADDQLETDEIDVLRHEDLNSLLYALDDKGVSLGVNDFVNLITGGYEGDDEVLDAANDMLEDIFSDADVDEICKDATYEPKSGMLSPAARDIVDNLYHRYSLHKQAAVRRAVNAHGKEFMLKAGKDKASDDVKRKAKVIIDEYTKYKLAFVLHNFENSDINNLTVLQNFVK